MIVLAIDPGTERSGWVLAEPLRISQPILMCGKTANSELEQFVGSDPRFDDAQERIVERFMPYGQPIGESSIQTILWTGIFIKTIAVRWGRWPVLIPRHEVKSWLCKKRHARDSDVIKALIEYYGPRRSDAVGRKGKPGPLHGITGDVWQALALALVYVSQTACPWHPRFLAGASQQRRR